MCEMLRVCEGCGLLVPLCGNLAQSLWGRLAFGLAGGSLGLFILGPVLGHAAGACRCCCWSGGTACPTGDGGGLESRLVLLTGLRWWLHVSGQERPLGPSRRRPLGVRAGGLGAPCGIGFRVSARLRTIRPRFLLHHEHEITEFSLAPDCGSLDA